MGVPLRGVEILGVEGTKVVGSTRSDVDGRFELADAAFAVARFTEPFLGALVRPIANGAVELDVERDQIVRLVGTVTTPSEVTFDWVDVKLTPRVELPPVVVLWEPEGLREAMWIRRYVQPNFEVRVLKGMWEIRGGREIDGPLSVTRTNLVLGSVTCNGVSPAPRFAGFEVEISDDANLAMQMALQR
jgi:hypothetical protein